MGMGVGEQQVVESKDADVVGCAVLTQTDAVNPVPAEVVERALASLREPVQRQLGSARMHGRAAGITHKDADLCAA